MKGVKTIRLPFNSLVTIKNDIITHDIRIFTVNRWWFWYSNLKLIKKKSLYIFGLELYF